MGLPLILPQKESLGAASRYPQIQPQFPKPWLLTALPTQTIATNSILRPHIHPLPGNSRANSPPTFWEAPSTHCKIPCLITKQQIFQVENSLDFPFQRHPLLPLCRQPPMHGARRFTKLFLHPPPPDTGAVREFSWNSVCGRVQVLF